MLHKDLLMQRGAECLLVNQWEQESEIKQQGEQQVSLAVQSLRPIKPHKRHHGPVVKTRGRCVRSGNQDGPLPTCRPRPRMCGFSWGRVRALENRLSWLRQKKRKRLSTLCKKNNNQITIWRLFLFVCLPRVFWTADWCQTEAACCYF